MRLLTSSGLLSNRDFRMQVNPGGNCPSPWAAGVCAGDRQVQLDMGNEI